MTRLRVLLVGAVLAALVPVISASSTGAATVPVVRSATQAAGLPSHFGIGLSGHPDDTGIYGWMPNSGIPFDYAYQYLAGGVNTPSGWATWNTSAQFPLWYAQGAAQHGYVPVFPYYQLLQSSGPCSSCGEAQKDLAHLNDATVMSGLYGDFATLMKRLGPGTYDGITGFGKTAVVHVEPDLSGYAEQAVLDPSANCFAYCTGTGNNPALLKASVASSGNGDVAAYPNTYQGFNWALLHLRDVYAPNVVLAFHVSDWATIDDIGSSRDTTLDATTHGNEAGAFAAASGVNQAPSGTSTYDLVFNDVADRDAAYYKNVSNWDVWWDRNNITVPNFKRWEQYLTAVTSTTGKYAMVWQVPLGNQYFDTENNTNGHYQDNRAEYFFAHISELQQAGVMAVLFGRGNDGSTTNTDDLADGVTNPASFCTADGSSSGQVCNNHASTVADDDGGYLRMAAAQYYQAPAPLPGGGTPPPPPPDTTPPAAPTVTSPSAAVRTKNASYTVAGTAEANALVKLWRDANGNGKLDAGEPVVASKQLSGGGTSWSVSAPIVVGVNRFLATATDAAGNQSPARVVPAITRR